MKYMTLKKKYSAIDLQLFAGDGGEADGGDSGDGDDQDDEESDEDGEDNEEKRYSQKDMDDAVKKRLAREKRKWTREQQKPPAGGGDKEKPGDDSAEDKEKKDALTKASKLEVKVACFEADVAKESVDDVSALAHAYMEADESLDLEDAIEKVVKKYPYFKKSTDDGDNDDVEKSRAWGQRHGGKVKKTSGVEEAFLKKNPGIKL